MMYSAWTNFLLLEFHASTRGAGVSSSLRTCTMSEMFCRLGSIERTYKIHCRHFTCRRKVRQAGVRIGDLCYHLFFILHCEEQCLVLHAICALLNVNTPLPNCVVGYLAQLVDVESHIPLRHLLRFVADKTLEDEAEEVGMLIPGFGTCV